MSASPVHAVEIARKIIRLYFILAYIAWPPHSSGGGVRLENRQPAHGLGRMRGTSRILAFLQEQPAFLFAIAAMLGMKLSTTTTLEPGDGLPSHAMHLHKVGNARLMMATNQIVSDGETASRNLALPKGDLRGFWPKEGSRIVFV